MPKQIKVSMEVILPNKVSESVLLNFFEDTEQRLNEYLDGELPDDCNGVEVKNLSIFNKHRNQ